MTTQKRKKRFQRDSSVRLSLTERDLEIIRLVYKHRFLTSEHITAAIEGSGKGILRRLGLLFHGGYLDRPREQLSKIGNNPMIYGLGNKGADLLSQELDLPLAKIDWTTKNREAGERFLDHSLMVANFMIMVKLACEKVSGVEFIEPEEVIDRRPQAVNGKALEWRVEVGKEHSGQQRRVEFGMVPDGAFGLRFTEGPAKKRVAWFFLEADRSTMPVKRNNLVRSSFYKKMVGYWESWRQGLFEKNFAFKNPRILTVTISRERAQSMIDANKSLDPRGKGLRMFLFAPEKNFDLKNPEKILENLWINGREEKSSLLD